MPAPCSRALVQVAALVLLVLLVGCASPGPNHPPGVLPDETGVVFGVTNDQGEFVVDSRVFDRDIGFQVYGPDGVTPAADVSVAYWEGDGQILAILAHDSANLAPAIIAGQPQRLSDASEDRSSYALTDDDCGAHTRWRWVRHQR